jgi:hypothetical protein
VGCGGCERGGLSDYAGTRVTWGDAGCVGEANGAGVSGYAGYAGYG